VFTLDFADNITQQCPILQVTRAAMNRLFLIMNSFDAILFFILGGIGLYMGFTNKKTTMWSSFVGRSQDKRWIREDYVKIVNIVSGVVCVIIGGVILFKSK
jgi:uncharacterized membrane protein